MSFSFIAAPRAERAELSDIAHKLGWKTEMINVGAWSIAINDVPKQGSPHASLAHAADMTSVLIGEVLNRTQLKTMLCMYDSNVLTANDAELVQLTTKTLGESALALIEGSFICLQMEGVSNSLSFFGDAAATMTGYVTTECSPWVASEIKLLCQRSNFRPDFTAFENLLPPSARPDNYSPVRNVRRLKPGEILRVSFDGHHMPVLTSTLYHAYMPRAERNISKAQALQMIDLLMRSAVDQCVTNAGRVGIPLSGGLDSSLITALARPSLPELRTFSIGTEISNEFIFAEQVAKHLGTRHQEFLLSDGDVLTGLIESIYHNEIYDGLSAEIQAPLFALYRKTEGLVDTLVTGYGSDLLFGGILPLQAPARDANLVLWEQVYRTRWTGEFSSFGACHYGLRIRHPFWSNRLIGFCLDLCASLKVSEDEVKIVLREYAANNDLLPKNIIWRKKIGIHEGSSVNSMFAKRLGTEVSSYEFKSLFAYFIYREFLLHGQTPETIDPDDLMRRFETSIDRNKYARNY